MNVHLHIIGTVLMILSLVHVIFPKYFHWSEELKSLSLINRQMFKVHTFFIALTVFLMGLLCVTGGDDLINTRLGKMICLGLGVFWLIRLCFQLFVYSPQLWKGKRFETVVHIVFTMFWAYMSGIFIWVAFA